MKENIDQVYLDTLSKYKTIRRDPDKSEQASKVLKMVKKMASSGKVSDKAILAGHYL